MPVEPPAPPPEELLELEELLLDDELEEELLAPPPPPEELLELDEVLEEAVWPPIPPSHAEHDPPVPLELEELAGFVPELEELVAVELVDAAPPASGVSQQSLPESPASSGKEMVKGRPQAERASRERMGMAFSRLEGLMPRLQQGGPPIKTICQQPLRAHKDNFEHTSAQCARSSVG